MDYVGYTARRLHQRIAEYGYSVVGNFFFLEAHGDKNLLKEGQFGVLEKWKFDCLVYETLLFITELNPSLNTQGDSITAKLLV